MANPAPSPDIKQVSMNAQFISAFLTGTVNTLKIQCSYEITPQKSYIYDPSKSLNTDICGIIGLTSSFFCGAVTLCFSEKLFLCVMGSMFGETFTSINDELSDGAGELLNIIFGTAKTTLTNAGYTVEKAIPTVIRGKDIKVTSLTGNNPTVVVPFTGKDGDLSVLISIGDTKTPLKLVKNG